MPDTTAPTVTLTGPDTLSNLEPFAVTATFSEVVTGFDAVGDITVTNGTAAVPIAVDNSAATYTLTITPAVNGKSVYHHPCGCCNGRRRQHQPDVEHSDRGLCRTGHHRANRDPDGP
ncbi:MAG: Ig-like domain-containing protein [Arenicellales bacterium WSBS_2016_MAG_OTU3]